MKYSIKNLGENRRFITGFERKWISKLLPIQAISEITLIYDDTLQHLDDEVYVLLRVKSTSNKERVITGSGDNPFLALKNAINDSTYLQESTVRDLSLHANQLRKTA